MIDASTLHVVRTLKTGWEPVGVTTDRAGKFLYTANTLGDDISVINLSTGKEIKRLAAGHFHEYVDLSDNGKDIYISNLLGRLAPPNTPPESQVTVVSTAKQIVTQRIMVPGVIQMRHIAQVPEKEEKDVGLGCKLPLYVSGSASIGWWGILVTMLADLTAEIDAR